GEGDGAAVHEAADLGQLLAFAALGDGTDGEDVGVAGALGLEVDELRGGLAVDGRLGVGHARHRREAAGQRRCGAGADRLVLLAARLAQVNVHVNESGADDLAGRIDGAVGLEAGVGPDTENLVALDPQLVGAVDLLRRVDDAAVDDAGEVHAGIVAAGSV